MLPIAAQHPAQLYLASSFVLLGLAALAGSYGAIATLVTGRAVLLVGLYAGTRRAYPGSPRSGG